MSRTITEESLRIKSSEGGVGATPVIMVDWNYPKTVNQAVERLISDLSLKDRVYIANLAQENLYLIQLSLRSHLGQELGLCSGNKDLIESCRIMSGSSELRADHCPEIILQALWRKLRETHTMRVVAVGPISAIPPKTRNGLYGKRTSSVEAQLLSHQDVDMVVDPDILKRISGVGGYDETDDIMIHYTVTADCPFNCRGCINSLTSGQVGHDGAARASKMDEQEDVERDIRAIAQLIRQSRKAQAVIVFYGGEPMLRLDKMNRVCERLSEMVGGRVLLKYMVVTSGHYLERSIQRYPGLTTHMWLTAISIDGTEAQHNAMRKGTSLETIKRQVAYFDEVREGEVLIWSTIRPDMSLLDCFESFMYFRERGQAEHFFWHLDEAEGIIVDLPDYVARYGAHLDKIMKVYVDHLKGGDLLSIIHVNELILYLLAQKRRGSTACGVEKMANFDIIGDGKVHACADLPETKCIGELAESGEIIFEPDARARLRRLVAYKGDLGCKACGVEAYCGGRCPVQIHTGGIERARQYCFMMREHVRTVKKYTGQIADLMLEHGLTLVDIYRSARFAKYTDVTP